MLSAALLLCLCSSPARAANGEMRWMEEEARKWSMFLSRNDGVRGREGTAVRREALKGVADKQKQEKVTSKQIIP